MYGDRHPISHREAGNVRGQFPFYHEYVERLRGKVMALKPPMLLSSISRYHKVWLYVAVRWLEGQPIRCCRYLRPNDRPAWFKLANHRVSGVCHHMRLVSFLIFLAGCAVIALVASHSPVCTPSSTGIAIGSVVKVTGC